MKRLSTLLAAIMICGSIARGGDLTITAFLAESPKDQPTTQFTTVTPKITAFFKAKGDTAGTELRGVFVADDVGDDIAPGTTITTIDATLDGKTDHGAFSCTRPTNGWPVGDYHVEIYANGKLATQVKFTIDEAEKAEKRGAAETEAEESDSSSDDQYTFKVENKNVQRITSLLASEDGRNFKTFDIGKGIDVGETVTLNWDKSTNNTDCYWWLKAVYADKSVGEAVRFNFCEEDLVIDF
jgi:hypothetical protein